MRDESGFFLIITIVFVLTWIFSNGHIYPESFKYAKLVCEGHQGLKFLDEDKTEFSEAVCNDGVVVKYNNSEVGKK